MRWLYLALLAGCSFTPGVVGDDQVRPDGDPPPIDAPPCMTFSAQVDTCTLTSGGSLVLAGDVTFDTGTGELVSSMTPVTVTSTQVTGLAGDMMAIVVDDFELAASAKLRATGPHPFAIIAFGAVTIRDNTLIDVSDGGAGARMSCPDGAQPGMPTTGSSTGGGGGGGGGFAGNGGKGGQGDNDDDKHPGGDGGVAVAQPAGPLGGCPGAQGGVGSDPPGQPGSGGGAIYIVSAVRIGIANGGINAGGGGGRGGPRSSGNFGDAGGGGGGSGGMIWLEAPEVRSIGTLAANGGGGGEASGNNSAGREGQPGQLGTARANGGSGGSSSGTDGGRGGARDAIDGDPVTNSQAGGGGGGGGGAGFVIVTSPDQMIGDNVSP